MYVRELSVTSTTLNPVFESGNGFTFQLSLRFGSILGICIHSNEMLQKDESLM